MCGIAGMYGENADQRTVLRMLDPIRHRGRDDQGVYSDKRVGIGCNRLAIIDLSSGHQPMSNEEGTVWVAFNGEIYNHNELREALRQSGHRFSTRSDTEVIIQSYEEWGTNCFAYLKGMFAIALWDTRKHTLNLARDRVGIKPLYYTQKNGSLLFASEIKAILSSGLVSNLSVNKSMVDQLLEVGYPLEPETLLIQIHQIPPGHRLEVSSNGFSIAQFWKAPPLSREAPDLEKIRRTLKEAVVSETITSDVPVGAFLSGGLDTSTIVAFASHARLDGLKTYCMGFNEPTDEFADARLVAEAFGTDHQEIIVDASHAMAIFPLMVWHSETPKVNLYSWFVNEAASKYVKVCLSGLGGDELFAGYPSAARFRLGHIISRYRRLGPFLSLAKLARPLPIHYAKFLPSLRSDALAYSSLITGFPAEDVSSSVKDAANGCFSSERQSFEQKMVRAEFCTKLPYDYLLVEDAMSMAHTLEVRVPFLHDDLVNLMLPVPYEISVTRLEGKRLLRAAVKNVLPPECFSKPKWGFSVNVFSWWKNSIREYAIKHIPESKILPEIAPKWYEKVRTKIALAPIEKDARWYSMAWIMLGLEAWAKMFLEGQPAKAVSW